MNTTSEKKNFFYIAILILTFIAVIIGATFAVYNFLHTQKPGSSTVYTGTLSVEYLSGEYIFFNELYPINEPDFKEQFKVYKNNFKVTNTGTLDGVLTLNIDIDKNEFSEGSLKYKLFNSEGEVITNGVIPKEDSLEIASSILLEADQTIEYILMIWLEENGENQNQEMRKELKGLIRADVNQKRD